MTARLLLALLALSLLLPATAREVSQSYRGLRIVANLEMAEGSDYADGMVLLLHGFGAHYDMEMIREAQRALRDNGRNSLAINLSLSVDNRHGFYGCEKPQRFLQEDAVDELAAWVAWMRGQGVGRITILGHSSGANQVLVYAIERSDPAVKKLVLLAPAARQRDVRRFYLERYGVNIDDALERARQRVGAGEGARLMPDTDTVECARRAVSADSFLSHYSQPNRFRRFRDNLSQTRVPTLVISGSADERQPNTVRLITPYVDGRRVQVNIVDGAGHFFRDFNIDEAMEAAIAFIDETE